MSLSCFAFRLLLRTSTRSYTLQQPGMILFPKMHRTLRRLQRRHRRLPTQRPILSIEAVTLLPAMSTALQCRHSQYGVGLDGR